LRVIRYLEALAFRESSKTAVLLSVEIAVGSGVLCKMKGALLIKKELLPGK
jgi:hypothetical protein